MSYCCRTKNTRVGIGGCTIVYILLLLIRQGHAVIYTKYCCCSGGVHSTAGAVLLGITIVIVRYILEIQNNVCSLREAFTEFKIQRVTRRQT